MNGVIVRLGLTALLLVLASCSQHVVLSEDFPVPVMRKIATPVTLYLPPELGNYTHSEKPDPGVNWTIEFGASNARLFEAVVRGMFDKVTVAYTLDEVAADATVLKPVMKQYQFSTPGMSKTDYYEVWIKYALQLYHPKNTRLMDWPFTAYGREEPDGKSTAATMREASRRAMRDAAAAVVLGFAKQPAVVSHFNLPAGSKTAGETLIIVPSDACKLLFVALLPLALAACVSSSVEQLRTTPVGLLEKDETIVVLGRRQNFRRQTEGDFTDCVQNHLQRQKLAVKPEEQFMDEMFPWFQPRMAPLTAEALAMRLQDPELANRLRETGTRYIVWLDGVTTRGEDGGTLSCSVGVGGGACLGLLWWEDDAKYEAVVWDMQTLKSMGKISVEASGTSYVPAVIIPIPLIAPTMSAACNGVARQIGEFLVNSR